MSVSLYTDVCFINVAADFFLFFYPLLYRTTGGERGGLWLGVLFVQDVVMARSIEEENAWVASFGENVMIDCSSFASIHVLHQDGHV